MVANQSIDNSPGLFEFRITRWLCILPLVFFIVPMLWMSIIRVGSMSVVLGFTLVGVILTSFFAKDWNEYWGVISKGMLKPSVAMFVLIFTIVGIFAKMVAKSNVAGGVIWLASATGVEGTLFTAFVFVACCILSTGSGSSMATVLTLGPPLYPAGVILGADPFLLTGALVAGANFGDNLAPVSDTTIVSAAGQTYQHKEGQQAAFIELRRVLKPGGEAFITVWNRWQPRFWFKRKEVTVPWRTQGKVLYRYYYLFSYSELERLAVSTGFQVLKSFPESSYRIPIKLFSRNICLLVRKND